MAVSRTPPVPPVTTQPKLTGKGSNGRPPVRYAASARKQYATIHHPSTSLLATVIAKTPIDNFTTVHRGTAADTEQQRSVGTNLEALLPNQYTA
jgi:hypothetical protein